MRQRAANPVEAVVPNETVPAPTGAGVAIRRLQPVTSNLPNYLHLPENWQVIVNDLKARQELFRHGLLSNSNYVILGTWNASRSTAAYLGHMLGDTQFRHSPLEVMLIQEGEHAVESFTKASSEADGPSVHLVEWPEADFGQRYPSLASALSRIQDISLAAVASPKVDLVTIHHQPPSILAIRMGNRLTVAEPPGYWLLNELRDALGTFAPKEMDRSAPNSEALRVFSQELASHPEINLERVYSRTADLKRALIIANKPIATMEEVAKALTQ